MMTCILHSYVYAATKSGRNETIRYLTVTKKWDTMPWPRLPVEGEMVKLAEQVSGFKVSYVSFYPSGDVYLSLDESIRRERIYSINDVKGFEESGCEVEIGSPADPMGLERFREDKD